ncbi:MAG TPA: type II toxin-antitoxin system RelE/ParE family toxin [Microvirga sp.]|jgi:addiction module RelE/StbE family toxin|nr:type II toxin-antitoxin system RelE/ParE family toxin [Microvirga sp.]
MKVSFSRRALRDVASISSYIARANPRASAEVLRRIEETAMLLGEFPDGGHEVDRAGVRVITVPQYPYRLFYIVRSNREILVLNVRHTSRRPLHGRPQSA